ncbi:hypothetical protein IY145_23505 [Methylosinus sp. H3A]|uniref:hypothetical protein n=1 Tax=Methylosinus sp. H3A TaxID=2785786 RepID=UPI0018C343D5|nr:hypothetical protein [Methylosinus sp. H3A]MBG0812316.1 hypothetical protein [Methylosinus sp. H3A]
MKTFSHSASALMMACLLSSGSAFACATYNAAQISEAIQNSSYADDALKSSSCTWGGAAVAESGGNTCASNGNNFGVLQLTSGNLPAGMSSSQYLNLSLQQQVDIWLQQAGPSSQGNAFNTLNSQVGQSINGYTVTQGTVAACAQFGSLICSKDLASLQASGQCPSLGNGGVRATRATLANRTANLDGNGQSICSWGNAIQNKINASGCSNQKSGQNDCPQSPTQDTGTPTIASSDPLPSAASQPTAASSDINVSPTQI